MLTIFSYFSQRGYHKVFYLNYVGQKCHPSLHHQKFINQYLDGRSDHIISFVFDHSTLKEIYLLFYDKEMQKNPLLWKNPSLVYISITPSQTIKSLKLI